MDPVYQYHVICYLNMLVGYVKVIRLFDVGDFVCPTFSSKYITIILFLMQLFTITESKFLPSKSFRQVIGPFHQGLF